MSDIIQLLPDSVANQIAAGEVIQRPASVVKELVENSVDAGAKKIEVVIIDAGRTLIQIVDDGKGMSETDARLAFERHSTSKIRQADDLFTLHTMGFRGEALASIVAVAQVDLTTRQSDSQLGTHLKLAASKYVAQEPCSCGVGCNFKVSNLFYNVPARRKFLKSNTTEMNNIITAFQRIALVYPDIAFTLHSNGALLYDLKAGNMRERIVDIFGRRINQDLLPVKVDTTLAKITGFVGKPESAKKKSVHQYFFVNGRYMRHPYFHKAVMNAFERIVPAGEQVPYFLYFDVPADNIDVNIHPTKTEIKFENEQAIWQILAAGVHEAVGFFNEVPSIDFDTKGQIDMPTYDPTSTKSVKQPTIASVGGMEFMSSPTTYNPFEGMSPEQTQAPDGWEQLYEGLRHTNSDGNHDVQAAAQKSPQLFDLGDDLTSSVNSAQHVDMHIDGGMASSTPRHYQYKATYIMSAAKSGLIIISQHRASVRVCFENMSRNLAQQHSVSQQLLFTETLQLMPADVALFQHVLPQLEALGFVISPDEMGENGQSGSSQYIIKAIPAGLEGVRPTVLIEDILAAAHDVPDATDESTTALASVLSPLSSALLLSLAQNAAIPDGQILSTNEMESLVNELFACQDPNFTPDGKRIIAILNQKNIDELF